MACNGPLKGWTRRSGGFTMKFSEGFYDKPMDVPCGQCMGCKLDKSRDWAARILHESQMHDRSSFVTLTYNPENYPPEGSINKRDLQLFFKKFRKAISPKKIRYFACGEYGAIPEERPHYHLIIFNYWPEDPEIYTKTEFGTLYTSKWLEEIWGKGFTTIGEVNFETAAYTSRYVTKKLNGGNEARFKYRNRDPEFGIMSNRPGIGFDWLKKYYFETIRDKNIIIRGGKMPVPTAYNRKINESLSQDDRHKYKWKNRKPIDQADNTFYRLITKNTVQDRKFKFYSKKKL